MNLFPKARSRDVIEQTLGNEMLIYDLQNNTAYSLNETSAIIYQACDGTTTFDEIKRKHKFDDDLIFFALDELNSKNLLEDYSADNFEGMSRRDVIKKVGMASMIALPVIASIVAPRAANASSSGLRANGQACTQNTECTSGACSGTKQTCCNRNGPGATGGNTSSDLATCTTTTDCCLQTTTSRCQNGVCCRNAGINCATGANNTPAPQLCCSNSCTFKPATAQTTCD